MGKKKKGIFIVLYGINNLGKSTQAKMLVDRFKLLGLKAEYLKYPLYDLDPTGPLINGYLRQGNPFNMSSDEVQVLYAMNRTQYEPRLKEKLDSGISIIAEDYTGTGIAWGVGAGGNPELLRLLNSHLLHEDIAFLFTGNRFSTGREKTHKHETDNIFTEKVSLVHERLAKEYGWHIIDANRSRGSVNDDVWSYIVNKI